MCSMKFNWMVSLVIICQSVGKAASCCCIYIPSLMALCPGRPGSAGTRKVPIWILLKQETVSGSGISWAICKSAPRSRQITTPARHHSVFYRPDALPAAQPTASKHWREQQIWQQQLIIYYHTLILSLAILCPRVGCTHYHTAWNKYKNVFKSVNVTLSATAYLH